LPYHAARAFPTPLGCCNGQFLYVSCGDLLRAVATNLAIVTNGLKKSADKVTIGAV
jgi:hypothetical protein